MALLENLVSSPLKTFDTPSGVPAVSLKHFSTIGSHSWTEVDGDPLLVVPGRPPQWTDPRLPLRVAPDEGRRFIDYTGAQCQRLGVSRLVPLVQAVEICTPSFDFGSVDLICNRNNIRNLLSWIETPSEVKDFRIDVTLVNKNKTVLFQEYEIECTEFVPEGTFRGFGDNFRRRCVREATGQTRHNRVVTYQLGDVKVMMGHKVEAHCESITATTSDNLDDLISSLGGVALKGEPTKATASTSASSEIDGDIPVRLSKDPFKDYKFAEIKTMAHRKEIDWRRFHPQLYLAQTDILIVARHARGQFVTIDKFKLSDPDLKQETRRTERSLGKLLEVFHQLFAFIKASEDTNWALVCTGGSLCLHKSEEPLPQDMISRFD